MVSPKRPKQHGALPRRIVLPYPYSEILSGYEEDVSSIRDGLTAWVNSDFESILNRHVVQKVFILLTARHIPESILPPPLVTASAFTCQIVQLNRRGSAFIIGILVLDMEKQELLIVTFAGK